MPRAAGTDDRRDTPRSSSANWCKPVRQGATAKRFSDDEGGNCKPLYGADSHDETRAGATKCDNEGDGARTRNLRIDSPVL